VQSCTGRAERELGGNSEFPDTKYMWKASAMDVAVFDTNSNSGATDEDGNYPFDLRLPDYFVGRPLDHGAARVLIEATVKDAAGHSENRGEPIVVSQSPLLLSTLAKDSLRGTFAWRFTFAMKLWGSLPSLRAPASILSGKHLAPDFIEEIGDECHLV